MSFGNTFENDLMKIIFNGTAIANLADNAATDPLTDFHVSLHTADVGEAGNQTTSECAYTGYGRIAVARTSGGWTVTDNEVENAAAVQFAECTGGTSAATHFAIGIAGTSTGKVLAKGALGATLNISAGIAPYFPAGDLVGTLD